MTRSLIFWSLLPFVAPQGIVLRRTAPRFDAAGGPTTGIVGTGPRRTLIAVGDSIVAGVGASTLENALVGHTARALATVLGCEIAWSAHGRSGADASVVLTGLVPRLPANEADVVIVSVGVNDITAISTVPRWLRHLNDLVHALQRQSPGALIAFLGIPPLKCFPLLPQPLRGVLAIRGAMFDAAARRAIADRPAAIYVPIEFELRPEQFSADGYHPSEESYGVLGRLLASRIAERIG